METMVPGHFGCPYLHIQVLSDISICGVLLESPLSIAYMLAIVAASHSSSWPVSRTAACTSTGSSRLQSLLRDRPAEPVTYLPE